MCLQAELPLWIALAHIDRKTHVFFQRRAIHGLHEKVIEFQRRIIVKRLPYLRNHHFQFTAFADAQFRAELGTDTNPVDTRRHRQGAIGFNGDFKAAFVHAVDECRIKLQQWLAAGKHHIFAGRITGWPQAVDGLGKAAAAGKFATEFTVGADKIGIAECTYGGGTIALAARPEITSGKAAEDGRTPRLGALALECVKNLFYAVSQKKVSRLKMNAMAASAMDYAFLQMQTDCPLLT